MNVLRLVVASTMITSLIMPIAASTPSYAGRKSEQIARGIVSGAWAGAGYAACGKRCAAAGARAGGAVFDGAQWFTTTVGPKIRLPRSR